MRELTHTAISVDVMTSMVAVVTVVTVVVIGLATLARPSRATITWGAAFALGMLGTYLWVGGLQLHEPRLTAGASGLLLCFEPLLWLGLRMHRGARPLWWPSLGFMVLIPTVLVLAAGTPAFQVTFRLSFLSASVFAGLVAWELIRLKTVSRDITMPLLLAACSFVVVAIAGAVSVLLDNGVSSGEQLSVLRGVNSVGTVVTSICAAFTLVLLVRSDRVAPATGDAAGRAARRLRKAEAQNDHSWSVLDVRLDDPLDLREASTSTGYAAIVERFHSDIEEVLPASADADRVDDSHSIIVIRGSEEEIRHHIRALLQRISAIEHDAGASGIRVSASIGWASASAWGHDYDALAAAAGTASASARADGGDRWKRAEENGSASPATLEA
ncbi:hypothetical protein GCM10009651_19730 [Microbacterium natoriense]|uniref:hypothetical protein n=1 Tax=Microbacterium TaxID=33882 RepID=UPI000CFBBB2C|nr:hypothetical protein [Microbacterium sp. MYb72]PRB11940.1 hypothetical protein CQ047_02495 [Microbacterium sp. MYb72]